MSTYISGVCTRAGRYGYRQNLLARRIPVLHGPRNHLEAGMHTLYVNYLRTVHALWLCTGTWQLTTYAPYMHSGYVQGLGS
jgi:hypothetical protein